MRKAEGGGSTDVLVVGETTGIRCCEAGGNVGLEGAGCGVELTGLLAADGGTLGREGRAAEAGALPGATGDLPLDLL